jgi:DNA-binding transcriptional regulator of glucitol operon
VSAFLTPRWLGLHALLVVSVLLFLRIGFWQWDKAASGGGSWQNYGYAAQWWLFAAFAVFLYVKLVLDELDPSRTEQDQPQADLPPVQQPTAAPPADDEDDELAAYNRYLRELHERSQT